MIYQIQSFKGLDTRKSVLTSVPGTLETLTDMHVNQGGELQKRLAFAPTTASFANTFGGVGTPSGIVVFGSVAANTLSLPNGFVYQQLVHPDGTTAMSGVVSQTLQGNFAFVVAQFADGQVFPYYNGTLVSDFTAGDVLANMTTNASIAASMTSLVNATGAYTAVQNTSTNAHELDTFSQPGNSYASQVQVKSKSGITIISSSDVSYQSASVYATDGTNAADGSVLVIGSAKYRFKTTMAQAFDVQIGATIVQTVQNLYLAIGATGVAGTNYYTGTTANSLVYPQTLVLATAHPNFQLQSIAANTQGLVKNTVLGIDYEDDAETVARQIATSSIGQFKIVAMNPAAYAGIVFDTTTKPASSSTLTIGSFTGTFGTSGGQINNSGTALQTMQNFITTYNAAVFGGYKAVQLTTTSLYVYNTNPSAYYNAATAVSKTGTLNWTTSAGFPTTFTGGVTSAINYITLNGILASGSFATNGTNPTNGKIVTIGTTIYTFKTLLSTTGDVAIGANYVTTLTNLIQAINNTGVNNVDYISAGPNLQAKALPSLNNNTIQLISLLTGTLQNSIAISTNETSLTASGSTMAGGSDTLQLLPAPSGPWNLSVSTVPNQSVSSFALAVSNAINGYSSTSGYSATVVNNTVYIHSVAGNSYANQAYISVTSVGQVCVGFCGMEFNAAQGTASDTNLTDLVAFVTAISINGKNALWRKHGLNSPAQPTNATTISGLCQDIVTDITDTTNNATTAAIYTAVAQENVLYISKLITTSNDTPLNVTCNVNSVKSTYALTISQIAEDGLTAAASPSYVGFLRHPVGGGFQRNTLLSPSGLVTTNISLATVGPIGPLLGAFGFNSGPKLITDSFSPILVTCKPTGGYPPYSYQWRWISGDSGFIVNDETKPSVTFSRPDTAGSNTAFWVCTVTDSLGNSIDSNQVKIFQP